VYLYANKDSFLNLLLIRWEVQCTKHCSSIMFTTWMVKCRAIWREQLRHYTYNIVCVVSNCLSAIRFRGGVILQVSCYTLLMRIPTSMASVLLSAPHGTPFRVYRKVGADKVKPGLSWERQVESLIASSAYQKWPTTNYWYNSYLRWKLEYKYSKNHIK